MQEMVQEEALWISWYTGDDTHVISTDFKGYTVMPGGIITDLNIWTVIGLYNEVGVVTGIPADPKTLFLNNLLHLQNYRFVGFSPIW